jgi:hypothetical protein
MFEILRTGLHVTTHRQVTLMSDSSVMWRRVVWWEDTFTCTVEMEAPGFSEIFSFPLDCTESRPKIRQSLLAIKPY